MKTLFLNRHAKSNWKNPGQVDIERPLNKRGKLNAKFMAERFAKEKTIDLFLSSPARRAIDTARAFILAQGRSISELQIEKLIYGAAVRDMISMINQLDDKIDSVIIFGHNPTFNDLTYYLDHAFHEHLVTCARVKIEFDHDSWSMVSANNGRVVYVDKPRDHEEMKDL